MKLQKVQPEIFDYLWQNRVIFRQINTFITRIKKDASSVFFLGMKINDGDHQIHCVVALAV